jgi:hypothetical protein
MYNNSPTSPKPMAAWQAMTPQNGTGKPRTIGPANRGAPQ